MKKLLVLCLVLCACMAGCKNVPGLPCQNCENFATLQGTIMDAVTGERIGGTVIGRNLDIEIYLIQGATIRKPTTFISDEKNSLVGEYSFTSIPAGGTDDGDSENNEYKLVVIKEGYQRFEAKVSLVDIDNKIGNVYLFPEGYATPDYTFQVVFNGAPVDNATVLFKPVAGSNVALAETGDILAASAGYLPSLTAFTDISGRVTFEGSELGLGAAYKLIVLPKKFEGVSLGYYQDLDPRIIGLHDISDIISLDELAPGGNAYGLYVVSISNSEINQYDATGTLTMVFSRPVTLGGEFGANESSSGTLVFGDEMDADLSADGLTLTMTPNWATPPGAADHNSTVTYTNGTAYVSVQGYPDSEFDVFGLGGLTNAAGIGLSAVVHLAP